MESKDPTCFTCGLPLTDPPRLNHLPSGAVCSTCRDRLLEALPALLPGVEPPRASTPTAEPEPEARPGSSTPETSQASAPAGPRPLRP